VGDLVVQRHPRWERDTWRDTPVPLFVFVEKEKSRRAFMCFAAILGFKA
jgi:hypothetical protein